MKQPAIPRTPFSTGLSGSARETELRIRNLFAGPKKRPPVLLMAPVLAMCLLCGNLVSCQEAEQPPEDVQHQQEGSTSRSWPNGALPLGEDLRQQVQARLDAMGDGTIAELLRGDMDQAMEAEGFQSNEFWTWTDSATVSLCALAGEAQRDCLLVRLYTGEDTLEYALYSPDLWAYILQHYHQEGEVDQAMLERIQPRVDALIRQRCREMAESGPGFAVTGGDVVWLKRLDTYDGLDFSSGTAALYDMSIALTGADLSRVWLSGGQWVDDLGRLRDDYTVAYAAILEEEGEITKVVFLAGDAVGLWGYSEEGVNEFRLATENALRQLEDGASG